MNEKYILWGIARKSTAPISGYLLKGIILKFNNCGIKYKIKWILHVWPRNNFCQFIGGKVFNNIVQQHKECRDRTQKN